MHTKYIPVFKLFFLILITSSLISCNKDNRLFCTKGKGDIVSENRPMTNFNRISLQTNANVFVNIDEGFSVRVKSYENIASLIKTELSGSTLFISRDECIRRTNDHLNVYVTLPDLDLLEVEGAGNIIVRNTFNTFSLTNRVSGSGSITMNCIVQQMNSEVSGSGNIHLTGSTNVHNASISGSGDIRSFSMNSSEANVTVSGSGNADIRVNDVLNVEISGSGNVRYLGFPSINSDLSGSGSLLNMNNSDFKFD